MATLLDIAPQFDVVPVAGAKLDVYGLPADAIAALLFRFPELQEVFKSGIGGMDADTVTNLGGEVVGAIIAYACRLGGNADAETKARSLGAGDQLAILKPCWDRTFPKGVEDFLKTLGLARPGADEPAAAAATS